MIDVRGIVTNIGANMNYVIKKSLIFNESKKYMHTQNMQKEHVVSFLIHTWKLNDNKFVKSNIERQLAQKYFNNFKTKFDKLSKNKKNYDEFESNHLEWWKKEVTFVFDPQKEKMGKSIKF